MEFKPTFNVGDYIAPIQKSIFCELEDIGLITAINKYTYTVKTKNKKVYVHFQFQELYRTVVVNKQHKIRL